MIIIIADDDSNDGDDGDGDCDDDDDGNGEDKQKEMATIYPFWNVTQESSELKHSCMVPPQKLRDKPNNKLLKNWP